MYSVRSVFSKESVFICVICGSFPSTEQVHFRVFRAFRVQKKYLCRLCYLWEIIVNEQLFLAR